LVQRTVIVLVWRLDDNAHVYGLGNTTTENIEYSDLFLMSGERAVTFPPPRIISRHIMDSTYLHLPDIVRRLLLRTIGVSAIGVPTRKRVLGLLQHIVRVDEVSEWFGQWP